MPVRAARRWFCEGSERTRVQRLRTLRFGGAGGDSGRGDASWEGSLPKMVCETATVLYPTRSPS